MHEMSIAVGLVDLAVENARANDAGTINSLEVEIGALAGVEIRALEFCWDSARKGTPCASADLNITTIPGRGRCPECGVESEVDFFVAVCPACDEAGLEITQGREMKLRSLNVD